MLCILAGDYLEAKRWAYGQELHDQEWFFPTDEADLLSRKDFSVIVVGTAGQNVPSSYFEKIFRLAKHRGALR